MKLEVCLLEMIDVSVEFDGHSENFNHPFAIYSTNNKSLKNLVTFTQKYHKMHEFIPTLWIFSGIIIGSMTVALIICVDLVRNNFATQIPSSFLIGFSWLIMIIIIVPFRKTLYNEVFYLLFSKNKGNKSKSEIHLFGKRSINKHVKLISILYDDLIYFIYLPKKETISNNKNFIRSLNHLKSHSISREKVTLLFSNPKKLFKMVLKK